jgi:hypothetical protein
VSPLWRDEIGAYLAPHKLTLTRLARGLRPRTAATANWVNSVQGDGHWGAALAALDGLLAKTQWQQAPVRAVVADHWVRYAMVPYVAELSGAAERLAHARHVLAGVYGEIVSEWTVTLSDSPPGTAQLACAMPSTLIEEMQAVLARHGTRLLSLQPQLVSAYNHWRGQLPEAGAWFVSIEQGSLAAARLAPGGWDRVHCVRIGADWTVELRRLQTFGRLANSQAGEGRVYVDAPAALRIAAGASSADLIWLEQGSGGKSTAGRLEYRRRHQA